MKIQSSKSKVDLKELTPIFLEFGHLNIISARIYHKIHAYFGLLKLKLGHVDFENSGPPKYPQVLLELACP